MEDVYIPPPRKNVKVEKNKGNSKEKSKVLIIPDSDSDSQVQVINKPDKMTADPTCDEALLDSYDVICYELDHVLVEYKIKETTLLLCQTFMQDLVENFNYPAECMNIVTKL
jgi:hypothetical protein